MSKLVWDQTGEKEYETGVDHGVLYLMTAAGIYPKGVAWNGLTGYNSNPEGAESNKQWADNIAYLNLVSPEEYQGSISAFTYPDEFMECDGSKSVVPGVNFGQQKRTPFGFVCRTMLGNDTEGVKHGYKLHLVYGLTASPSEKSYETQSDDPEAIEFEWDLESVPVDPKIDGFDPVSEITITSTDVEDKAKLQALEAILFGTEEADARLPLPNEVATLMGWTAA